MVRRFVVRLYSTVMHEYQHARQWQRPAHARAMGQARREVDAFFWEIEHSQQTGLRGQTQSFRQIWREAQGWWRRLRRSTAWRRLSVADRQRYTDWHQRVARIASSVLNTRP